METKQPEVIETAPVTTMATIDVRDASAQGLALMEERVKNQKKMLAIAIGLTAPNQWTVFAGTDKSGVYRETIYPTGGAADTILRRAFGLTWAEKEITVEETPDGKLATCSAWLMRGNERMEHFTGYRFLGGYIKNEADLRKGALENLKSVAVRDLLGLRFRTPAELKEMGLDVGKLERRAEFQSHEKDPGAEVVSFGKNKGELLTDISDGDLAWHGKAARESVDDPSKSKWKKKNIEWLKACIAEHKRRNPPAEKPAEEPAKTEEPPHDPETGEVQTEVDGQPVLCAQPGCDSPATHGVYCGGHLPSQKGQGSLDMGREPGQEG